MVKHSARNQLISSDLLDIFLITETPRYFPFYVKINKSVDINSNRHRLQRTANYSLFLWKYNPHPSSSLSSFYQVKLLIFKRSWIVFTFEFLYKVIFSSISCWAFHSFISEIFMIIWTINMFKKNCLLYKMALNNN